MNSSLGWMNENVEMNAGPENGILTGPTEIVRKTAITMKRGEFCHYH